MRGPYVRSVDRAWYLRTRTYRRFMVREATSVFIAAYLVFLLVWLRRLAQGPDQFEAMVRATRAPLSIAFHGLVLAAALYHSITWFNLTPQVMPVRLGEERLPRGLVAVGMGYLPWLVISIVIVRGMLR